VAYFNFSGKNCEIDEVALGIDCGDNPCRNGATCIPGFNTYRCECTIGWTGRICDREVPQCEIPYSGDNVRVLGLGMAGIPYGNNGGSGGGSSFRGKRETNSTDIMTPRSLIQAGGGPGVGRDIYANRIVGGEVSVAGAWPWIIQIADKYGHYCSGTINSLKYYIINVPKSRILLNILLRRDYQRSFHPNSSAMCC